MSGADLSECDLTDAVLDKTILVNTSFSGATLLTSTFNFSNMKGAILCDANAEGIWLNGAILEHANLRGADLYWARAIEAGFSEACMASVTMCGALLNESSLKNADLSNADLGLDNLGNVVEGNIVLIKHTFQTMRCGRNSAFIILLVITSMDTGAIASQEELSGNKPTFLLWNEHESIASYAQRVNLLPTNTTTLTVYQNI